MTSSLQIYCCLYVKKWKLVNIWQSYSKIERYSYLYSQHRQLSIWKWQAQIMWHRSTEQHSVPLLFPCYTNADTFGLHNKVVQSKPPWGLWQQGQPGGALQHLAFQGGAVTDVLLAGKKVTTLSSHTSPWMQQDLSNSPKRYHITNTGTQQCMVVIA